MENFSININLKTTIDNSYQVYIEKGLFDKIPDLIKKTDIEGKFFIISDSNVFALYGKRLIELLINKGFVGSSFVFKAGEKSKNRKTKEKIENYMLFKNYGRDSFIIALGGGVTGDIAGFVAATYNRGIPFFQIPTTIVSMVDSSVGGKTGIDTKYGKNLIGSFQQPKGVFIDPFLLNTLSIKERINGIAEIIKHACIKDIELFNILENNIDSIINNHDLIIDVIRKNVLIKAEIVEKDEREAGLRKILNFGHTIGHAIEKLTNYKMGHGECVAIGMVAVCNIGNLMGITDNSTCDRICKLISDYNLPTRLPKKIALENIISATNLDKKAKKGKAKFILLSQIGKVYNINEDVGINVDNDIILAALSQMQE